MDRRVVWKAEEDVANGSQEDVQVSARQIGPSDRSGKQRIADKELFPAAVARPDGQAHAPGAVTRRGQYVDDVAAELELQSWLVVAIDRRWCFNAEAEQLALADCVVIQELVIAMQPDRRVERGLRPADAREMVEMRVCQQDRLHGHPMGVDGVEEVADLV